MFDYRYHAVSLAAVLMALAVGVLLGVAIGDSNLVSSAKSGIVRNLRGDVGGLQRQAAQLRNQLAARHALEANLYPLAVNGRLANRSIGLLFLGPPSDRVDALVRDGLTPAGARLSMVGALRQPLDLGGLAREAGAHYADLATNPAKVRVFGSRVGTQLVQGGQLAKRVRDRLLSSFNGQIAPVDGIVFVHADASGLAPQQAAALSAFEAGLLAGINGVRVPAVGVELTDTNPSQVAWYRAGELSSVDDLDDVAGQTALVYALAGARGTYGTKATAESLLPRAVSAPASR